MAAFILSEDAENRLHQTDTALAALESLLISLGDVPLECRAAEMAAPLAPLREPLHTAREAARFDTRAG